MSKLSRDKGARWEREVANLLTCAIGVRCDRQLEEVRDGNLGDVKLPPGVPLSVQAKVGARPPIYEAVKEACAAARPGHHPVAIIRRNGAGKRAPDDLAVLPLADFLELISQLRSAGVW